jgi:hypothetical protein
MESQYQQLDIAHAVILKFVYNVRSWEEEAFQKVANTKHMDMKVFVRVKNGVQSVQLGRFIF